jgi:hypothetical protein
MPAAKICIRLRLLNGRLELLELRPPLAELVIKVWRRNDREHVAVVHLAADVDIAPANIAGSAGKESRTVESSYIAGQLDRARVLFCFGRNGANARDRVQARLQYGLGLGFVVRFAPHAKPKQAGDGRDQRETQYPGCRAPRSILWTFL